MDLAELGVKIDTSQAAKGAADLDKFAAAATNAEKSVGKMKETLEQAAARAGVTVSTLESIKSRNLGKEYSQLADNIVRSTQANAAYAASAQRSGAEISRVANQMALLKGVTEQVNGALQGAIRQTVALVAAGYTLHAFREAIADVSRIGEVADRTGATAREVQTLRYAVQLAGGAARDADNAYDAFSKRMGEAATGQGYLAKLFNANTVSLRDQKGEIITTGEGWLRLADIVAGLKTQQERVRVVSAVLGQGVSKNVVDALGKGREGLRAMGDEATRLGIILEDDVIAKGKKLDTEFSKLEQSGAASFKRLAVQIGPIVLKEIDGIIKAIRDLQFTVNNFDWSNLGKSLGMSVTGGSPDSGTANGGADAEANERRRQFVNTGSNNFGLQDVRDRLGMQKRPQIIVGPKPGSSVAPASGGGTDLDRQIKQIEKQTAALEAESKTFGMTERAANAYRIEQQLIETAQRAGIPVTGQLTEQFKKLGEEYARVKEAAAAAKLQQDILFERQQLGRSDSEQRVQSTLRGSGIDAESESGKMLAQQLRVNEALRTGKELATDFVSGFVRDVRSGASAMEALNNAVSRLADKLIDMAINQLVANAFKGMGGAGGGGGFNFMSMFGPGQGVLPGGAPLGMGGIGAAAQGAAFDHRGVMPFAKGGIVNRPTLFPFAKGTGLMGEAGPEAIMPLARGPGGQLGVHMSGGGSGVVNNFIVENHTGAKVEESKQQNSSGGIDHRVVIRGEVKQGFADGEFQSSLNSRARAPQRVTRR